MSVHDLKIHTMWLDRVLSGEKRAEVRKHDRDYQVGDTLHMREVDGRGYDLNRYEDGENLGPRTVDATVTHVLDGRLADGIDDDCCVLSIALDASAEVIP